MIVAVLLDALAFATSHLIPLSQHTARLMGTFGHFKEMTYSVGLFCPILSTDMGGPVDFGASTLRYKRSGSK